MTQEDYRQKYKTINKIWHDSVSVYKDIVTKLINSETTVLEAGCGFSNLYREEYKRAKKVIGVDISPEYLNANDTIHEKIVSDLSHFPQVQDLTVDIIISSWVLEHLESPEKVFSEFSRVLKPGGKVAFITPNARSYVVIINKLIPTWFRNMVAKKLSNNTLVVDPMKTFYHSNSIRKIKKICRDNNLIAENLILNGDPTYIAINRFFFGIGVFIERILSIPFLRFSRVHIIGVLQKKN